MTEPNPEADNNVSLVEGGAHAPDEVLKWARKLTEAQGCQGKLTREASGYHLYIPCPDCLETHGRRELQDPKYSINLSMVVGIGEYGVRETDKTWMPGATQERMDLEKRGEYASGICMRTRSAKQPHRRSLSELLFMDTITERHPDIHTSAAIVSSASSAENEEMWEEDPISGKMGPPPPGETTPLSSLPENHPAVKYLTNRSFDIKDVESQFRASFCHKEYPHGENGIFWRRMPGGWKDTTQHRIIFYSMIDGAPLTWQARLIEKVSDDGLTRLRLHPYVGGYYPANNLPSVLSSIKKEAFGGEIEVIKDNVRGGYWAYQWSETDTRSNPQAAWQPLSPFDEERNGVLRFQPSKYRTAKYSSRQLMGWDAATQRAKADSADIKWAVLCEGPLDAARVGPGGIAVIGSSLNMENTLKVAQQFHLVFLAFDADKAGRAATEKIAKALRSPNLKAPLLSIVFDLQVPSGRDLGDLTRPEYEQLFKRAHNRVKRLQ